MDRLMRVDRSRMNAPCPFFPLHHLSVPFIHPPSLNVVEYVGLSPSFDDSPGRMMEHPLFYLLYLHHLLLYHV